MSTISVIARRWEQGWELEIDPDNITQSRTLDAAAQQVRDYLGTLHPDRSFDGDDIHIEYELGRIGEEIVAAREATLEAREQQLAAAQRTRELVVTLVRDGYSGADVAAILGVSRARVSQLLREGTALAA